MFKNIGMQFYQLVFTAIQKRKFELFDEMYRAQTKIVVITPNTHISSNITLSHEKEELSLVECQSYNPSPGNQTLEGKFLHRGVNINGFFFPTKLVKLLYKRIFKPNLKKINIYDHLTTFIQYAHTYKVLKNHSKHALGTKAGDRFLPPLCILSKCSSEYSTFIVEMQY